MSTYQLTLAVLTLISIGPRAHAEQSGEERAEFYSRLHHGRSRPSERDLQTRLEQTRDGMAGLARVHTVLAGALYRGGSGGLRPLTRSQLRTLCREGFSRAVYLYAQDPVQDSVRCTDYWDHPNTLTYTTIDYRNTEEVLAAIAEVLNDPDSGPIYVHCWGGAHAAGQVTAIALRQWCRWSAEQAVRYWTSTTHAASDVHDFPHVPRNIRRFTPIARLAADDVVCPQR